MPYLSRISMLKEFFNLTSRITIKELKKRHVLIRDIDLIEGADMDLLPFSSARLVEVLVYGFCGFFLMKQVLIDGTFWKFIFFLSNQEN